MSSEALIPPIWQSANFRFDSTAELRAALLDEQGHYLYTRGNNPGTELLRARLAELEGAEDALVFGSGSAAIAAALLHQLKAGDHVLCVRDAYPWTTWILRDWLPRFGVTCTFVDGRYIEQVQAAFQPNTRVLMLESPNSFCFDLQDLASLASIARARNCLSMVDNSYCSPLLQRPLELGIDLVLHSATKYLNGHGDVVAGVICGNREQIAGIFKQEFQGLGAILSPHDAWLMLRGLHTLPLRMERIGQTALWLVDQLALHPRVERVLYPFHPSHPQYELAQRQMKGPSGQFSIVLSSAQPEITERFCDALKHFHLAVSWGGVESLVLPAIAKSSENPSPGLVRFCAGLEEPALLWEDLQQALDKAYA